MLSKSQISYIRSLQQKKYRQMYRKFLVEGEKQVLEAMQSSYKTEVVYATEACAIPSVSSVPVERVTDNELQKIATQQNPDGAIAVVHMPETEIQTDALSQSLYLVLDAVNDPGNAGSIIRIADWFGIQQIFLTEHSVDVYNPKTVAAAKGSLFRVACTYVEAAGLFAENPGIPVYGTFMDGENIYEATLSNHGFIVLGNEANGISSLVAQWVQHRLTIPRSGQAESLNVAVAAGIVLSEFKRR